MPRNYRRKNPDKRLVTQEQIDEAKRFLEQGVSQRAAADRVGISESALRKRLSLQCVATSLGRFKPTFTSVQENEIVEYCLNMDNLFYGITIQSLRRLVFQYAELNKIPNRFDKATKMAGRDWVGEFLKRHERLRLRQSIPTSLARAIGFNKVQVDRFFGNLKELYETYNFNPNRIFNMDETGMSTVPKKTPRVVSVKGKKVVGKVVSAERGITITAVCCMSATGQFIPPAFIFPRKRMKGELLDAGPTGCVGMVSDSGFINSDLFMNWLYHFSYHVHPTKDSPVLLILDNHSSHINLEASLYCRERGISVVTLAPHSSHKVQPLDRSFFGPLKAKYTIECDRWMTQHPGRAITQYQVAALFNEAYKQVATVGNAASGFSVTGIYPFNDGIFQEHDFLPATVTDNVNIIPPVQADENEPKNDQTDNINIDPPNQRTENEPENKQTSDNTKIVPPSQRGKAERKTDHQVFKTPQVLKTEKTEHIALTTISPMPKRTNTEKRKRKPLKSEIITSSPFKEELENKQNEELAKSNKRKKRTVPLRSLSPGPSGVSRISKTKKLPNKEKDYFCPLCHEKYEDPPAEEWIQCFKCEEWWHEQCTSYETGVFLCDSCK